LASKTDGSVEISRPPRAGCRENWSVLLAIPALSLLGVNAGAALGPEIHRVLYLVKGSRAPVIVMHPAMAVWASRQVSFPRLRLPVNEGDPLLLLGGEFFGLRQGFIQMSMRPHPHGHGAR